MKRGVLHLLLIFTLLILISKVNAFEFCDDGENGENKLRIISVDDMEKQNPLEWSWQNSEEIEIEVRVQNRDKERKDYKIELIFIQNDKEKRIVEDKEDLRKEIELDENERKSVSFQFKTESDIEDGEYELYVKFYNKNDEDNECVENSEERIKIKKIKICKEGNVDEDNLEIKSIIDENSDTEWEWEPNKKVELLVDIENKDYTIEEYETELILLDKNGEEVSFAEDSDKIKKERTIEEDNSIEIEFDFNIKNTIDEGTYYLYAKVYAKEDTDICTSLKAKDKANPKKIIIKKDDHNVIVTSVDGPEELEGGQSGTYTATLTNLGSKDEERVKIMLYNSKLDINIQEEITNLGAGEEKQMTFQITIPEETEATTTKLRFSTEFKYDENTNYFDQVSADEDDIQFLLKLTPMQTIPEEIITPETIFENLTNTIPIETEEPEIEETIEETTDSPITAAVVGKKSTGKGLTTTIITIVVLFIAIGGILIYRNKKKKTTVKTDQYIDTPEKIVRRYTAKLPSEDFF